MRKSVCSIAESLVKGARRKRYGSALDDFSKTAVLWSVILGVRVSAEQVAMCMDSVKTSREIDRYDKNYRDNRIDKCGYANCLDDVTFERARRNKNGWTFDEVTGRWQKPRTKS